MISHELRPTVLSVEAVAELFSPFPETTKWRTGVLAV